MEQDFEQDSNGMFSCVNSNILNELFTLMILGSQASLKV